MYAIRGREAIEANISEKLPSSYEVNAHARHYTKGYVTCYYTFSKGWLFCGVHESFEEAVKAFDEVKWLYDAFPDQFNWMEVSNMVIFHANGCDPRNPSYVRWYPCAIVVEE